MSHERQENRINAARIGNHYGAEAFQRLAQGCEFSIDHAEKVVADGGFVEGAHGNSGQLAEMDD